MEKGFKSFFAVLLFPIITIAGNRNIIVKQLSQSPQSHTEVRISENPASEGSDSLVIIPGVNASYVDIKVKDFAGNTESEERITVTGTCTEQPVETQEVSDDKIVEVSDDNGFYGVY